MKTLVGIFDHAKSYRLPLVALAITVFIVFGVYRVIVERGRRQAAEAQRAVFARAIDNVIQQDKAFSREIQSTIGTWEQIWGASEQVNLYAQFLRNLDLSQCPPDFRDAFLKHAYAWTKVATAVESASGVTGFMRGLGGVDTTAEVNSAQREVADTWYEVDRIARGYGVMSASQ